MATTTTGSTTSPTVKKRQINIPKAKGKPIRAKTKAKPKTATRPMEKGKGTVARARQQGGASMPAYGFKPGVGPIRGAYTPGQDRAPPPGRSYGGAGNKVNPANLASAMKAFSGAATGGGGAFKAPPASAFMPKTTPMPKPGGKI